MGILLTVFDDTESWDRVRGLRFVVELMEDARFCRLSLVVRCTNVEYSSEDSSTAECVAFNRARGLDTTFDNVVGADRTRGSPKEPKDGVRWSSDTGVDIRLDEVEEYELGGVAMTDWIGGSVSASAGLGRMGRKCWSLGLCGTEINGVCPGDPRCPGAFAAVDGRDTVFGSDEDMSEVGSEAVETEQGRETFLGRFFCARNLTINWWTNIFMRDRGQLHTFRCN